jgi:hypothetical protein
MLQLLYKIIIDFIIIVIILNSIYYIGLIFLYICTIIFYHYEKYNKVIDYNNSNSALITNEKKILIKNLIKKIFMKYHNYTEDEITDNFLNSELSMILKFRNIKLPEHFNIYYSNKEFFEIKNIIRNKNI